MTAAPRVSVIMAVYNGTRYLREAIDSVLSQDFQDFEFVIVDDCSTDGTPEMIAGYGDARIVYLRNPRNAGQTASLNTALRAARAPYIARIDADDAYQPGKLRRQVEFLDANPDVAVCGTSAVKFDGEGHEFGLFLPPVRLDDIRFAIHHRVPVCHVSVMMRRDPVLACGGYDERYKYAADYALWSRLLAAGQQIANLPQPLMKYREFRESLGAIHKVGAAGDESATIIRDNARELAGVELTADEARHLALLYFPAAGLSPVALCDAQANLRRLAQVAYAGRVPGRVGAQLRAVLFWSLLKRAVQAPAGPARASIRRELRRLAAVRWREPLTAATILGASALSRLGEDRIARLKASILPRMQRALR